MSFCGRLSFRLMISLPYLWQSSLQKNTRSVYFTPVIFFFFCSLVSKNNQVNNLPEGLPAAKGRMAPTDEISTDFAETYSNRNEDDDNNNSGSSSINGNGSGPQAGGALHRNISQGQVSYDTAFFFTFSLALFFFCTLSSSHRLILVTIKCDSEQQHHQQQ